MVLVPGQWWQNILELGAPWVVGWGILELRFCCPQSPPKARRQQMDLISELKRKQQKEPLIYESDRDGAIEDIITGEGGLGLRSGQTVLLC